MDLPPYPIPTGLPFTPHREGKRRNTIDFFCVLSFLSFMGVDKWEPGLLHSLLFGVWVCVLSLLCARGSLFFSDLIFFSMIFG